MAPRKYAFKLSLLLSSPLLQPLWVWPYDMLGTEILPSIPQAGVG